MREHRSPRGRGGRDRGGGSRYLSAAPAQAITFSQHIALSGLSSPGAVALDAAGDLFVSTYAGATANSVIELPYGAPRRRS